MDQIFFNNWQSLLRILVIGISAYVSLLILLRISGKRTLSKMNAFDFVVTVALGSTLATVLLTKSVTLAQGVLVFALLIGMQYAVTWSSVRVGWFRRLVTGEPSLLFYQGEFLAVALRKSRVTRDELKAAVRGSGFSALEEIEAVVLETDGSFSIIGKSKAPGEASLAGVAIPEQKR
ncbi:MAG: DUF421 domain-containing protein [Desulfobulbaceae bacterium]|nr:DUF421 domain-containing protein [Desulfobulbaceae bacterium]